MSENNNNKSKIDYTDNTLDPKVATKQCFGTGGCNKTLTLEHFTLMKTGQLGRSNICIDCRKIVRRKNINENPSYEGKKTCNGNLCNGKELEKKEFDKDKYSGDGLQSVCKSCFRNKSGICKSQLELFIVLILKDARTRAKKKTKNGRDFEYELDKKFILELYEKQDKKCAITKQVMTHNALNDRKEGDCHIMNPYNISIDRLNNEIGYIQTNVRLVCAFVNRIRMDMDDDEFHKLCQEVSATDRKGKKVHVEENIEDNDFGKFLDYKLSNTKNNAEQRNLDCDIKKEDIIEIYKKQKGKCVFTKNKLTFDRKSTRKSDLSIDRIDSTKGYTNTNIQLVENRVNISKSDISNVDYIEYCKLVAQNI